MLSSNNNAAPRAPLAELKINITKVTNMNDMAISFDGQENSISAPNHAALEAIAMPVNVLDHIAKLRRIKSVPKVVPGGALLVARSLNRKKSKSHIPVQKVGRDNKGNNPLLNLKAKASQRKVS